MDKVPVANELANIWVNAKNHKQFGRLRQIIEKDADDFSSIEITIQKHEGVIVEIVHKIKYSVRGKDSFDNTF